MFELPEYTVLARQINTTLQGKTIQSGNLGNSPHKFVWYNRSQEEFANLIQGKRIGKAHAKGRWLFIRSRARLYPAVWRVRRQDFISPKRVKTPKEISPAS